MFKVRLLLSSSVMSILLITGWAYSETIIVNNLNDSGDGSLRWAIDKANISPGPDTIYFNVFGTISSLSALPAITDDGTVIDASWAWIGTWPEGEPGIILDGPDVRGLLIYGADHCHIRGLFITNFLEHGVSISGGGQFNTVGGTGSGYRNVISGNNGKGVVINSADDNIVSGNYIGTDVAGNGDFGNSEHGVYIIEGAQSNTIGGTTAGERNIISGNGIDGVRIYGSAADNNVVSGNYIGTDVDGTADLGNAGNGGYIGGGAQSNTIGGTTAGERNIISGNDLSGVSIQGSGTENNVVSGNYTGTDVTGTADLGNSEYGVSIMGGAQSNNIGGATNGERNIISGNDSSGVSIQGSGTDNNVVSGNYIGTDVTGTVDLRNRSNGVIIWERAQLNTVGGITPGERNIISGNGTYGVGLYDRGTENNTVSGNYIGTDVTGTVDLPNRRTGVYIFGGAQFNTIGGTIPGERNIISGNFLNGVKIHGSQADNNVVSGNYIGTDVTGTVDLGNGEHGVCIIDIAKSNTVGGTAHGEGNIIAYNYDHGVAVDGAGTVFNRISRNSIHDNAGLGIDLVAGGNDEIPAPYITSAILIGDILRVQGTTAGADATVEVFEADTFASGEGMTYLGSLTADGSGNFAGDIDVTGKGVAVADPVTSTTTHTDDNTSEFSLSIWITESTKGGAIYGYVIDKYTAQPIENADVKAQCKGAGNVKTKTDASGYYELTDLEDGQWKLTLKKKGYKKDEATVEISEGGVYEQNFELNLKKYGPVD